MPLNTGLLAFYRLEDASDEFGSLDLTPTGTPTHVEGHIGDAASYPGDGSCHVATNIAFGLDEASKTIAFWFNPAALAGDPGILSNWANGGAVQWLIWLTGGDLVFQIRNEANGDTAATWSGDIEVDTWYFVVCTYDADTGDFTISVDDGTPVEANTATVKDDAAPVLEIGGRNNATATLDGLIDAVGFWDRVLSPEEITELYNDGDGLEYPFSESSLETLPIGFNFSLI